VVVIQNGSLRAEWAPEHGMVCASLRKGERELLGQRGGLEKYAATGSTFGIPLLHPWANRVDMEVDSPRVRIDGETGLPIHGLLNGWPEWDVVEATDESLRARFDFGARPELLAGFPYPHIAEVEASLGPDALTIATRVIPTGHEAVPIAFGWHPYFNLPDLPRDEIRLVLPVNQQFELDERKLPGEVFAVTFEDDLYLGDKDWDNGYAGVRPGATFRLSNLVEVEFTSGYPCAQIFSPVGSGLIAIEPMTAPGNALATGTGLRRAQPGDPFEAVFLVRVL
jgi:galactose mutarotase-like enzyme